jgi:hypothetical protein
VKRETRGSAQVPDLSVLVAGLSCVISWVFRVCRSGLVFSVSEKGKVVGTAILSSVYKY